MEQNISKDFNREELYGKIKNYFSMEDNSISDEWLSILSGIEGALYCLDKAIQFESYRNKWIYEAESIASELITTVNITEDKYPAWFSGFYLNNAELRISSALHRMIKAYLKKDKGKIWDLINEISSEEIPQIKVLKGAREKLKEVRYNDGNKSEEVCLVRVWTRANEIKHENNATFDNEEPKIRYSDSLISIEFILKLYHELLLNKQSRSSHENPIRRP